MPSSRKYLSPDILVFPGGIGTRTLVDDERVLAGAQSPSEHHAHDVGLHQGAATAAAGLLDG